MIGLLVEGNPFVGLRPFEADHADRFFGRREQTAALLDSLRDHRFLAVVGGSGCGKSSLIRAGLIPSLSAGFLVEQRDRWLHAKMKPGGAPLRNLAEALHAAGGGDEADLGAVDGILQRLRDGHTLGLLDVVQEQLGDDANLLLLVDQFEEIFKFRGSDDDEHVGELSRPDRVRRAKKRAEAADFVDLIVSLADCADAPIYTVLTMRTDFLGDCDLFHGLPEAMNKGRYLVPRLTRNQLREAIQGPAMLSGTKLSPRLLDQLLNEIGDRTDHLPVLQHALYRTWSRWHAHGADGVIDVDDFERAGGLERALREDAREALLEACRALHESSFVPVPESSSDGATARGATTLGGADVDRVFRALLDVDETVISDQRRLRDDDLAEGTVRDETVAMVAGRTGLLDAQVAAALRPLSWAPAVGRVFRCLTDTDLSQRRVRRPSTVTGRARTETAVIDPDRDLESSIVEATGLTEEQVRTALAPFANDDRNFVFFSEKGHRVDISHESLIRQWDLLKRWVDDERRSRDQLLELVKDGRREAKDEGSLLRDPELTLALQWRSEEDPKPGWARRHCSVNDLDLALSFLDKSERTVAEAREREKRRRRRTFLGGIALFAVLAGATTISLVSYFEADEASTRTVKNFGVIESVTEVMSQDSLQAGERLTADLNYENDTWLKLEEHIMRVVDAIVAQGLERKLDDHDHAVTAVVWGADETLFTGSLDGTVRAWNVNSGESISPGEPIATWTHPDLGSESSDAADSAGYGVLDLAVTDDDDVLIVCRDGRVRVWTDWKNGEGASSPSTADDRVAPTGSSVVAIEAAGDRVLSAHVDGSVRIRRDAEDEATYGHDGSPVAVATLTAGGNRAVTAAVDGSIRIWSSPADASPESVKELRGTGAPIVALAVDELGRRFLTGGWDAVVRLWDLETGAALEALEGPEGPVLAVAIGPDGLLAAAGEDQLVRVWRAALPADDALNASRPGAAVAFEPLRFHGAPVRCLEFSPDGALLSSDERGVAALWRLESRPVDDADGPDAGDAETWVRQATLDGHVGALVAAGFDKSGQRIYTAAEDRTVRLWRPGQVPESIKTLWKRLQDAAEERGTKRSLVAADAGLEPSTGDPSTDRLRARRSGARGLRTQLMGLARKVREERDATKAGFGDLESALSGLEDRVQRTVRRLALVLAGFEDLPERQFDEFTAEYAVLVARRALEEEVEERLKQISVGADALGDPGRRFRHITDGLDTLREELAGLDQSATFAASVDDLNRRRESAGGAAEPFAAGRPGLDRVDRYHADAVLDEVGRLFEDGVDSPSIEALLAQSIREILSEGDAVAADDASWKQTVRRRLGALDSRLEVRFDRFDNRLVEAAKIEADIPAWPIIAGGWESTPIAVAEPLFDRRRRVQPTPATAILDGIDGPLPQGAAIDPSSAPPASLQADVVDALMQIESLVEREAPVTIQLATRELSTTKGGDYLLNYDVRRWRVRRLTREVQRWEEVVAGYLDAIHELQTLANRRANALENLPSSRRHGAYVAARALRDRMESLIGDQGALTVIVDGVETGRFQIRLPKLRYRLARRPDVLLVERADAVDQLWQRFVTEAGLDPRRLEDWGTPAQRRALIEAERGDSVGWRLRRREQVEVVMIVPADESEPPFLIDRHEVTFAEIARREDLLRRPGAIKSWWDRLPEAIKYGDADRIAYGVPFEVAQEFVQNAYPEVRLSLPTPAQWTAAAEFGGDRDAVDQVTRLMYATMTRETLGIPPRLGDKKFDTSVQGVEGLRSGTSEWTSAAGSPELRGLASFRPWSDQPEHGRRRFGGRNAYFQIADPPPRKRAATRSEDCYGFRCVYVLDRYDGKTSDG